MRGFYAVLAGIAAYVTCLQLLEWVYLALPAALAGTGMEPSGKAGFNIMLGFATAAFCGWCIHKVTNTGDS